MSAMNIDKKQYFAEALKDKNLCVMQKVLSQLGIHTCRDMAELSSYAEYKMSVEDHLVRKEPQNQADLDNRNKFAPLQIKKLHNLWMECREMVQRAKTVWHSSSSTAASSRSASAPPVTSL